MDTAVDIGNYVIQGGFAGMCVILLFMGYRIQKEKQKAIDDFIKITQKFIDNQKDVTVLISRNNEILDSMRISLSEIRIYLNLKNNKK